MCCWRPKWIAVGWAVNVTWARLTNDRMWWSASQQEGSNSWYMMSGSSSVPVALPARRRTASTATARQLDERRWWSRRHYAVLRACWAAVSGCNDDSFDQRLIPALKRMTDHSRQCTVERRLGWLSTLWHRRVHISTSTFQVWAETWKVLWSRQTKLRVAEQVQQLCSVDTGDKVEFDFFEFIFRILSTVDFADGRQSRTNCRSWTCSTYLVTKSNVSMWLTQAEPGLISGGLGEAVIQIMIWSGLLGTVHSRCPDSWLWIKIANYGQRQLRTQYTGNVNRIVRGRRGDMRQKC